MTGSEYAVQSSWLRPNFPPWKLYQLRLPLEMLELSIQCVIKLLDLWNLRSYFNFNLHLHIMSEIEPPYIWKNESQQIFCHLYYLFICYSRFPGDLLIFCILIYRSSLSKDEEKLILYLWKYFSQFVICLLIVFVVTFAMGKSLLLSNWIYPSAILCL